MNLHEYQSKRLLAEYGLPVPKGQVVTRVEDVDAACQTLGGSRWVVKAQVHAGGRGKAGGVACVDSPDEASAFVARWLGQRLVTYQTTAKGQPVDRVLIEQCTDIAQELYLGAVVDRTHQQVVIMASTEGGVDIETVAAMTPDKILKTTLDITVGLQPYQARELAFGLGLNARQLKQFVPLVMGLARLFVEEDVALAEINPLVITAAGDLCCLDAKLNLDSNAAFRHADWASLSDPAQGDHREVQAAEHGLNYVALDGDIGCMVNGAGLAMGTMDLIKLHGGHPANFLDVGGGATRERVAEAFKLILSDTQVKAVLVNIFGGIVRCDMIAEGIVGAVKEVGVSVPVVVRLEGNQAPQGRDVLAHSGLNIIAATSLMDAAQHAVKAARIGVIA